MPASIAQVRALHTVHLLVKRAVARAYSFAGDSSLLDGIAQQAQATVIRPDLFGILLVPLSDPEFLDLCAQSLLQFPPPANTAHGTALPITEALRDALCAYRRLTFCTVKSAPTEQRATLVHQALYLCMRMLEPLLQLAPPALQSAAQQRGVPAAHIAPSLHALSKAVVTLIKLLQNCPSGGLCSLVEFPLTPFFLCFFSFLPLLFCFLSLSLSLCFFPHCFSQIHLHLL